MDFHDKLQTYANLLVCHGLNVQPGQIVNITAELFHREFVQLLVKSAYKQGAKFVHVDYIDPELVRTRVLESQKDEYLKYIPSYTAAKYDSFVEESACVLRLCGSEDPDSQSDLPADKTNAIQMALRHTLKRYYVEGVSKKRVQWTVAAAATPAWGKKVFPELDEQAAYMALWDAIFHICRADKKDCIEAWEKHQIVLHTRAQKLNDFKIKELHFVGPGTDLKVYLSEKARFAAGNAKSANGILFEANIPTEECFTTPDYRLTEGKVSVTRPVQVNGKLIKGLSIEFHKGEITNFTAQEGKEHFAAYIANDPGAKRLGEVALVGTDSPIYQSGRLFEEILYDENAACHIAVGFAYSFCLEGGTAMTPEELQELGCNSSHVHTDFMISSEKVDVFATGYDGKKFDLIKNGEFVC
ncbi:MAG: aminopeptidase [Chlamydiales bacterium]|nr:aminopeptidase [Chlamydiales bacterium]